MLSKILRTGLKTQPTGKEAFLNLSIWTNQNALSQSLICCLDPYLKAIASTGPKWPRSGCAAGLALPWDDDFKSQILTSARLVPVAKIRPSGWNWPLVTWSSSNVRINSVPLNFFVKILLLEEYFRGNSEIFSFLLPQFQTQKNWTYRY